MPRTSTWTSAWPPATAWTTDTSLPSAASQPMDRSCRRITDSDMAVSSSMDLDITMVSGSSTVHSHQHGPWWQNSPQTSTWLQAAVQTMDICMAFRGNTGHWTSTQTLAAAAPWTFI
ncbi:hypothetical protein NN561_017490 [Cricetulus griseus]